MRIAPKGLVAKNTPRRKGASVASPDKFSLKDDQRLRKVDDTNCSVLLGLGSALTFRGKNKVTGELKRVDTPNKARALPQLLDLDALEGKTPAEAANIKIEGRNKWVTVIQNAVSQN